MSMVEKVQQLVNLHNHATELGIDITEQVAEKMKEYALQTLKTSQTFDVYDRGIWASRPKLNAAEIAAVALDKKLDAIKRYRDRTGLGLIEAKYAVEQFISNKGKL